jgi:hypothetical protein
MAEFKIRRGLSTSLFPNGKINPKLIIEEGCWYLCTDTAELFLGVLLTSGDLTLKRINGPAGGTFEEITELFVKITSVDELPTEFEVQDFNPNITYYIPILDTDGNETGRVNTYIFDKDIPGYICTNTVDTVLVRSMVSEAIDVLLEESFADKLPETLTQTVLHGGNATPDA